VTRDEKLALVGEYVLGLLDPADRDAFEQQLLTDPEAAGMVRTLREHMQSLDASATGDVSAGLWARIEAGVAATPQDAGRNSGRVVPLARPAGRHAPLAQWFAVAASVVIAAGVGYFAGATFPARPQPTVIAVLLNADASPGAIIEAFADDSVHIVPLEDFVVPQGQVLQVWTLPDADTGPVSLGTLAGARDALLNGPQLPVPQTGQLYEITLEPAPGSPTGRPTGPILVKGYAKPPI
jgi:anti-sigma-K factor RskA